MNVPVASLNALLEVWRARLDEREQEWRDACSRRSVVDRQQCATEMSEIKHCCKELEDVIKDSFS